MRLCNAFRKTDGPLHRSAASHSPPASSKPLLHSDREDAGSVDGFTATGAGSVDHVRVCRDVPPGLGRGFQSNLRTSQRVLSLSLVRPIRTPDPSAARYRLRCPSASPFYRPRRPADQAGRIDLSPSASVRIKISNVSRWCSDCARPLIPWDPRAASDSRLISQLARTGLGSWNVYAHLHDLQLL